MAQNDKADDKGAAKKSPFSGYYNRPSQNDDSFLTSAPVRRAANTCAATGSRF